MTYTISFENPTGAARAVEITDRVPVGMEVIADSIGNGGVYDAEAHTVSWKGTVVAYGRGAVSFDCKVEAAAQGEVLLWFCVTSLNV